MSNQPLKKTASVLMRNSETRSFEFPTSPKLILGGELLHKYHPQHALAQVILPELFKCAGCKEYGAGKRYLCPQCDYQLHEFCALAPPALNSHPFHIQHQLLFHSKPGKKSKCDVCAKQTKGYRFRCSACSFQMHPCCAMLSTEINFSVHAHPLNLLPVVPLANGEPAFVCGECNRKRSGRVYRCTFGDYHLHAVCAKDMVNGLYANGIKGPEKKGMLVTAAKVATLVVKEFIGGLIEGFGEGIGEVFIQTVTRSGRDNTRRNIELKDDQ